MNINDFNNALDKIGNVNRSLTLLSGAFMTVGNQTISEHLAVLATQLGFAEDELKTWLKAESNHSVINLTNS